MNIESKEIKERIEELIQKMEIDLRSRDDAMQEKVKYYAYEDRINELFELLEWIRAQEERP